MRKMFFNTMQNLGFLGISVSTMIYLTDNMNWLIQNGSIVLDINSI